MDSQISQSMSPSHRESDTPNGTGEAAGPVNHMNHVNGVDRRDGHHSSSKDKHRSSGDKHKHSSSSGDKHRHSSDKHKHSSSSGDKHHSSSSSDKHKHSSSSSSHKHSSSKHHSSSSSSKHGSSSSSKHSSSGSSKHRDGSSSSSKHHSSSSSSHKSKDGHHSSSKDKHHSSKDRPHGSSHHSSSKPKEGSSSSPHKTPKEEPMSPPRVKHEPLSPTKVKMGSPQKVKTEPESDDDVPLYQRHNAVKVKTENAPPVKKRHVESDDDDEPLLARAKKVKKEPTDVAKKRKMQEDDDFAPKAKKEKKDKKPKGGATATPTKAKKGAKEEPAEKWKWWEEERKPEGVKWFYLEHKGPVFAAEYERIPSDVKFYYNGKVVHLSEETEEVATFYAKMLDHDYTSKDIFNTNFFKDWRKVMTDEEKKIITDLSKCNFKEMSAFFKEESERRKNRTKEEKNATKKENEELLQEYGFCTIDGHKEKIGNFKIEPPGLFRGRGEHPKMGMLKKRIVPEQVIINCSKDSDIPKAPGGHKWKEVRHDNTVTWLCSWTENIQGATKYVMLNPASKLKGEKDMMKYETARKLHRCVDKIRATYREDWKSKEMRIRQRGVALYFIDKLALRAGNEKDEETADTVGCCSLRVEHIELHEKQGDKEFVVEFDFLGKDSIRYQNSCSVEKRVFKNLQLFKDNKNEGDDLFDRLNTGILNQYLRELMEGLTAKVFRTYNASKTLQEQLDLLTNPDDPIAAKMLSYNRANRAVAVLCNHQRAAPKNFTKQMENLQTKIDDKKDAIKKAKKELKAAKADFKATKSEKSKTLYDRKKKAVARLEEQLTKLEVSMTDKDENKEIALGTSKLNYLDPRISVAWCKKWEVPIEKVYNKTQRDKFAWAIDMADEDYRF